MSVYVSGLNEVSAILDDLKKANKDLDVQFLHDKSQKKSCLYLIYIITPLISSINSIVNAVNDSNYFKEKTIFTYVLNENGKEFSSHQIKSLKATGKMIELNGGKYFQEYSEFIKFIENIRVQN